MKRHHHMLPSLKIAELHSELMIAAYRRQIEIRRHVANFHRHLSRPPFAFFQQKLRATFRPPLRFSTLVELDRLYVFGLPPFRAFYHVELHLLTFLQAAESGCLNRREMNEHILAVLTADEPIALCIVKPLYCSCFHCVACSFFFEVFALKLADFCRQVTLVERRNCLQ